VTHNHPPHERHDRTCPACMYDVEDAPTRPDLPRLQPLAMRIGNALAACPEPEAEELWRALRALQRCTPADRARLIQSIERHAMAGDLDEPRRRPTRANTAPATRLRLCICGRRQ
jgi:hypothetical protein